MAGESNGSSDIELVQAAWDAFARGDLNKAVAMLDPKVRWHGAGEDEQEGGCRNREEAIAFVAQATADGVTAELLDARPAGEHVLAIVQTSIPAEWGQQPEPHGELVTVRHGKIVEMLVFATVSDALDAVR